MHVPHLQQSWCGELVPGGGRDRFCRRNWLIFVLLPSPLLPPLTTLVPVLFGVPTNLGSLKYHYYWYTV